MQEHSHLKIFELQKKESLSLSPPQIISFPDIIPLKPTTSFLSLKSLSGLMGTKASQSKQHQINEQILYISNELFFMIRGNMINVYKYEGDFTEEVSQKNRVPLETEPQKEGNECLKCKCVATVQLSFNSKFVSIYESAKHPKDKFFYFLAVDSTSRHIELYHFDCLHIEIRNIKKMKTSSEINCLSFIDSQQFIYWCSDMQIYHYEVSKRGFSLLTVLNSNIDLEKQTHEIIERKKHRIINKSHEKSRNKSLCQKSLHKNYENKIIKQNFKLTYSTILGRKDLEQESILLLFYVLFEENYNIMKIKCKEILYPLQVFDADGETLFEKLGLAKSVNNSIKMIESSFTQQNHNAGCYEILSRDGFNPQLLNCINIIQLNRFYLAVFDFEVIFIEKKFGKYYAVDNIYKRDKNCDFLLSANSNTIACLQQDILEINNILIPSGSIKPHSEMIDFVDLRTNQQAYLKLNRTEGPEQYRRRKRHEKALLKNKKNVKEEKPILRTKKCLKYFWIADDLKYIGKNRKSSPFLIFELEIPNENRQYQKCLYLYHAKPINKIQKLIKLGRESLLDEQLQQIQKLGQRLGVNCTKFYFNLWKYSQKTFEDLKEYLIRCDDYPIIIEEIKNFLKKKELKVTQLFPIFKQMKFIAKQKLTHQLQENLIEDYFLVCFTERKLKMYSNEYQIGFADVKSCIEASLFDMIWDVMEKNPKIKELVQVDQKMNKSICLEQNSRSASKSPTKKKLVSWQPQRKQPPKIEVPQILHEFKLPIMQHYTLFLQKLFERNTQLILTIIEQFPELLPVHSYNQKQQQAEPKPLNQSLIDNRLNIQQRQEGIFNQIFEEDLKNEQAFTHNLQVQLEKYFPTSEIKRKIANTFNRNEIKDKKFLTHTAIFADIQTFKGQVKSLKTQNIYLFVLQKIILTAIASQTEPDIARFLKMLKLKFGINYQTSQKLQIISKLFFILLKNQIISQKETSIQEIESDNIEKWIALFFLGNKEKMDLFFSDFHHILQNNDLFQQSFERYVNSEHACKIEIIEIISLIIEMNKRKKQTQMCTSKILEDSSSNEANRNPPQPYSLNLENLMKILIDGFRAKIFLQNDIDFDIFWNYTEQIDLEPEYLEKKRRMRKLMLWEPVLNQFGFGNYHLQDFFQDPTQIFNDLFENFFDSSPKLPLILKKKKQLDEKKFPVQPNNDLEEYKIIQKLSDLIEFAVQFKEEMYPEIDNTSLVLIIMKKLEEWELFYQIQEFLYDQQNAEQMKFNSEYVVREFIRIALDELYSSDYVFKQQIIEHITKIIQLDRNSQSNPRIIEEKARLQLADVIGMWSQKQEQSSIKENNVEKGYELSLSSLNYMCQTWKNHSQENQGCNPKEFLLEMIEKYSSQLTFQSLKTIFKCFRTIQCGRNFQQNKLPELFRQPQFYIYLYRLTEIFMETQRLSEASETLVLLITYDKFNKNQIYPLTVRCYIESLLQDSQIQQGTTVDLQGLVSIKQLLIKPQESSDLSKLRSLYKLPSDYQIKDSLKKIKDFIDFLVFNYSENYHICNILRIGLVDYKMKQQDNFFEINPSILYEGGASIVETDDIWNFIVLSAAVTESQNSNSHAKKLKDKIDFSVFVYSYFFFGMALVQAKDGFQKIKDIPFDHSEIAKSVSLLSYHSQALPELYAINLGTFCGLYLQNLIPLLMKEQIEYAINKNQMKNEEQNKAVNTFSNVKNTESVIINVQKIEEQETKALNKEQEMHAVLNLIVQKSVPINLNRNFDEILQRVRASEVQDKSLSKSIQKLMSCFKEYSKKDHKITRKDRFKESIMPSKDTKLKKRRTSKRKDENSIPKRQNQSWNQTLIRQRRVSSADVEYVIEKTIDKIKNKLKNSKEYKNEKYAQTNTQNRIVKLLINIMEEKSPYDQEDKELYELVLEAINEERNIQLKIFPNLAQSASNTNIQQKFKVKPLSSVNPQDLCDSQFIKSIKNRIYSQIWDHMAQSHWIKRLEHLYNNPELKFQEIIQFLHSYYKKKLNDSVIGEFSSTVCFDKIKILLLAEPKQLITEKVDQFAKMVFPFQYLCEDFRDYPQQEQKIMTALKMLIEIAKPKEHYGPLIKYISEIQKIKYQKFPSHPQDYRNKIGLEIIGKLIEYTPQNVEKMHQIVELMGVDESKSCLKKEEESIMRKLIERDGKQMAEWFKQCLFDIGGKLDKG